jgi:hypothetical protein
MSKRSKNIREDLMMIAARNHMSYTELMRTVLEVYTLDDVTILINSWSTLRNRGEINLERLKNARLLKTYLSTTFEI